MQYTVGAPTSYAQLKALLDLPLMAAAAMIFRPLAIISVVCPLFHLLLLLLLLLFSCSLLLLLQLMLLLLHGPRQNADRCNERAPISSDSSDFVDYIAASAAARQP